MAPVEAQACGRPVIAFGKGGALETVVVRQAAANASKETCVLFDRQTPEALVKAILCFEASEYRFDPNFIRKHAQRFSIVAFRRSFKDVVDETLANFFPENELEECCEHSA